MSEMIERVAKAMCDTKLWPGAWERETEGNREEWRMLARAAIEAMREPTEAMVGIHSLPYCPAEMREYWHAMIDAALGLVK